MPTLLVINGLRFFFYSNENNEPVHVHISKGNANGKISREPAISIAYLHHFSNTEERQILEIVADKAETFKNKWNAHFSK